MELFKKYPSITNASQKKFVDNIVVNLPNETWIVTEKIHGANFSIIFDENNEISFGSRNQHLGLTSSFYDLPGLKVTKFNDKTLVQRATELNQHLREIYPNVTQVNMFGEYAGTLTQGNKVQREIEYGEQDFYLFDIVVTNQNVPLYLDKLFVRELANKFEISQPALLLITNNIYDALKVPNDFDSVSGEHRKVQDVLDVELTFTGKNITEGTVIEPRDVKFYKEGRVILKNKNSKFSENHTSKPIKKEQILSEEEQLFLELIVGYVNVNRVSNICSHFGYGSREEVQKNFGAILNETMQDAIKDIKKDLEDITLLDKVIKIFHKHVSNAVREFLLSLD